MKPKLLIFSLLSTIALGVFLGQAPWRLAAQEKEKAAVQVSLTRQIEAKREALIRRDAELRSTHGREALARKNGYYLPGELPATPIFEAP